MATSIEHPKEPKCIRIKDALMDVEAKLNELDDMRRKGMVTHQQAMAIKARINQWFVDLARQVM